MATLTIKFQDAILLRKYRLLKDIEGVTIDDKARTYSVSTIHHLHRLILNITRLRNVFLNQCRENKMIINQELLGYLPELVDQAAQAQYLIQKYESAATIYIQLTEDKIEGVTDRDIENLCDNVKIYK